MVAKYISEDKNSMLFKSFIISLFNFCPTVQMCLGRGLNNKIKNTHERAFQIVYPVKKSSFKTLLKHDKSMPIDMKNLQYLATALFKNGFSLETMN